MEKKLKALLEFQRFENNADLRRIIDSVHSRYAACSEDAAARELTLDEMSMLAAAGTSDREGDRHHERP